ncbi:EAL domain-containing protein [Candidatus Marinarcus aquaticus]|nr:bifunctional diguanylate cyclase/phosphodiesterase [Candidatus Marinarcus aquaticus]
MHYRVLFCSEQIHLNEQLISQLQQEVHNITIHQIQEMKDLLSNLSEFDVLFVSSKLLNEKLNQELLKLNINNTPIVYITEDFKKEPVFIQTTALDYIVSSCVEDELLMKVKKYNTLFNKYEQIGSFATSVMDSNMLPLFLVKNEKIFYANAMLLKVLKYKTLEELQAANLDEIFCHNFHYHCQEKNNQWFQKSLENENTRVYTLNKNKEHTHEVKTSYLEEFDTYVVNLNDITKEIEHEQRVKTILYTDALTQQENRSKLIHDLRYGEEEINSICLIDINSFKEINDFYGHKTGDQILIQVTELILDKLKNIKHMKLYKLPADIYCVTNLKANKKEFTTLIASLIEAIDKHVFVIDQYEIDVRVTSGISYSLKTNKLITADLALQAAKKDHKDYLVFFDELDNIEEYKNNMIWTKKLKTAIAKDNIIVYYQPLINNQTMKVEKYECLVRMIDEDSIISPFFFLDISKKSNQYHKITRSVIRKSCKEFENLNFEFSINISYEDIEEPSFLGFIKETFQLYDVANRVVFEILEDEGIKNYKTLTDFILEVKKMGCKVAIDDFGTGYSNFEHLLKMNIDYLKIDASLVKNIVHDENSYKVTKTIIEFAKNLNLKTIAEYVENHEIFEVVRDLGADYSQGYYFSAPLESPTLSCFKNKDKND